MKVQKVTLKDVGFNEINGEFEKVFINEKVYPAYLTNYSMKTGKEMGYIESSVFSDLAKLKELEGLSNTDSDEMNPAVFDKIDETKLHQVIYLAYKGANKDSELTFDQFLEKYHGTFHETIELYANLITDCITSDPNTFANEFKKTTKSSKKK